MNGSQPDGSNAARDEASGGPDLVDIVECRMHRVRKVREFPEPIAGGAATFEESRSGLSGKQRRLIGIDAQDVDVVNRAAISTLAKSMLLAAWSLAESNSGMRDAGGFDRGCQKPGRLADSHFRLKVAHDVDALRQAGCRRERGRADLGPQSVGGLH